MTIHSYGTPLSFSQIRAEFGGGYPMSMSQYFAGGPHVPAGTVGQFGAIPSSPSLPIHTFYGASATVIIIPPPVTYVYEGRITWGGFGGIVGYSATEGIGSLSPDTFPPYGGAFIVSVRFTGGQLDFEVDGNRPNDDAYWKTMVIQDWGSVSRGTASFTYIGGATNRSRWRWVGQANPFTGVNPKDLKFT